MAIGERGIGMSKPTRGSWYNKARELYEQGLPDIEVAKRCNVSTCAVSRLRYKNNLPSNKAVKSKCSAFHRHAKLYNVWHNMKGRCEHENGIGYGNYGGRGISICDEWRNNANAFIDWALANGYQQGLEIDRVNTNGNYSPANCRWVTRIQNQRNKRNNRIIEFNGVQKTAAEWAEIAGVHPRSVFKWLASGTEQERIAYWISKKGVLADEENGSIREG